MEQEEMRVQKSEAKGEAESSVKITVTKEAAEELTELVAKVNDGFEAGRVHRQDIASWIISKFVNTITDVELNQIRDIHYNDNAMLEAVFRKSKETGILPEFLRDALRKQFQGASEPIKRNKKQLAKEYINDVQPKNEEAS